MLKSTLTHPRIKFNAIRMAPHSCKPFCPQKQSYDTVLIFYSLHVKPQKANFSNKSITKPISRFSTVFLKLSRSKAFGREVFNSSNHT